MKRDFKDKYGPYAVVTGASSGIGAELAKQLAAAGLGLVLVARRKQALERVAAGLRRDYGVDVRIVDLDLRRDDAAEELMRRTHDVPVGLVVVNAASFTVGPFVNNELDAESDLVKVNVLTTMRVAHLFAARMVERQRGGILLVSSIAGHGAAPFQANYAASKAYVLSLGLSLHVELRRNGVDVTVLSPGPTRTEGVQNAVGIDLSKLTMSMMEPAKVARVGLDALGRKMLVIPGRMNSVMDFVGRHVASRKLMANLLGRMISRALVPPALFPERTHRLHRDWLSLRR